MVAPVLRRMRSRWCSTVRAESDSSAAICFDERPVASSRQISCSRPASDAKRRRISQSSARAASSASAASMRCTSSLVTVGPSTKSNAPPPQRLDRDLNRAQAGEEEDREVDSAPRELALDFETGRSRQRHVQHDARWRSGPRDCRSSAPEAQARAVQPPHATTRASIARTSSSTATYTQPGGREVSRADVARGEYRARSPGHPTLADACTRAWGFAPSADARRNPARREQESTARADLQPSESRSTSSASYAAQRSASLRVRPHALGNVASPIRTATRNARVCALPRVSLSS